MSNELPDLDEDVSFVVDGGSPVGPMPMRSIIDSIRSGERAPDVLVWWAGATDWLPFSSDRELFELLQVLPATNQPPPPPAAVDEILPEPEFAAAEDNDSSVVSAEFDEDAKFPEPEVTPFSIWPDESSSDDAPAPVDGFALEIGEPHPLGDLDELDELDESDVLDDAEEDEVDALLAGGPRAMHPSTGWGLSDETPEASEASANDEEAEEPDQVDVLEASANDDEAEEEDEEASDDVDDDSVRLTGLFGAPGLRVQPGNDPELEDSGLSEEAISARAMLQDVGARIDALASSTRRARESELVEASAQATTQLVDELEPTDVESDELEPSESESVASAEVAEVTEPVEAVEAPAGSWQAVEGTSGLEERFTEMVQRSSEYQRRLDWALRVDELLLSACITTIVDRGFVLLDLDTDGTPQRATFDHNDDSRQIRLELSPMSPVNAAGEPVGRFVQVSVAWTQAVEDADDAFGTVRAEATDDPARPGDIRCEANMVASSASTMVDLVWSADEYVNEDHSVDRAELETSVIAIVQTLESRWHELFTAAG